MIGTTWNSPPLGIPTNSLNPASGGPPADFGLAAQPALEATIGELPSQFLRGLELKKPIQNLPNIQKAHPCMSGGDCECGGMCSQAHEQIPGVRPGLTSNACSGKREAATKYAVPGISVTDEGATSSMLFVSKDESERHLVQTTVQPSNDVIVVITDSAKGKLLHTVEFKRIGRAGWQPRSSNVPGAQAMPAPYVSSSTTPNEFGAAIWATFIAQQELEHKLRKIVADSAPMTEPKRSHAEVVEKKFVARCGEQCEIDSAASALNISDSHDMRCTWSPDEWGLWLPCVGGFTVSIKDCCENHDINLWCGPPPGFPEVWEQWLTAVNLELAACIFADILKGTENQDIPWYCGGKITATAFGLVYATVISASYYVVIKILTLFQLINPSSNALPKDGRNKESCLCGGTKPTVAKLLDNPSDPSSPSTLCRNLCREKGKEQDCFWCHWQCDWSKQPPISVWTTDPERKKDCCPGSTQDCTCQCTPPECQCSQCVWFCDVVPDPDIWWGQRRGTWRLWGSNANAPCCWPEISKQHKDGGPCKWAMVDNGFGFFVGEWIDGP
jgi:hypothetical protein